MQYPKLLSALAAAALYCATSASVSAFTIGFEGIVQIANDRVGSTVITSLNNPVFPGSQTTEAIDGANFAQTTIDRAGTGDQVTLSYSILSGRTSTQSSSVSTDFTMDFKVTAAATYSVSGFFGSNDMDGSSGEVYVYSYLKDATMGLSTLYLSEQRSLTTSDETFALGEQGGDLSNISIGSLTGNLIAGHTYRWEYSTRIQAGAWTDSAATGTGNITLKINGGAPVASVPEAGSSAGLLALALAGLAAARRKLAVSL